MRRREFITLIGGAVASWPLAARAQQAMPVVGFVYTGTSEAASYVAAFHEGLRELGFVEGQNIAFEYRWPGVQYDQLPALMAELVRHPVALIADAPQVEMLEITRFSGLIPEPECCPFSKPEAIGKPDDDLIVKGRARA
jgi:putative ABC transport system substrate-binding protein